MNIPLRSITAQKGIDVEQIKRLYGDERLTQTQVAKRLDVTQDTIRYHIKKLGIGRSRSEALKLSHMLSRRIGAHLGKGEQCPNWKGGRRMLNG